MKEVPSSALPLEAYSDIELDSDGIASVLIIKSHQPT